MIICHILNVGKGSCSIIDFPSNRLTVIDIDNSRLNDDDTLTDPIAYIKKEFPRRGIFRFILTHPDLDHMSGLHELATSIAIGNFWDTDNTKSFSDDDWDNSPYDRRDWDKYQLIRKRNENPKCLHLLQDASSDCCWIQDGIRILAPNTTLVQLGNKGENPEYNHLSYVLMISHAGARILIGGDATKEAWDEIYSTLGKDALKANVFIAPHHGSKNNINERVFSHIAPEFVIASVAEGVDYAYDYSATLAKEQVLSTKHYGSMKITVKDDGSYTPIIVERNA